MLSASPFVVRLRRGLDDALTSHTDSLPGLTEETVFTGTTVRELTQRVHEHAGWQAEEDRVLTAVIRRCRRHSGSGWTAVLLEMLAPTLAELIERFDQLPPGIEPEDVEQQVVVEALNAIRSRLPDPPRWVRRQLELRIGTGLSRWLASTAAGIGDDTDTWAVGGRRSPSGVAPDDLALLYRVLVLGQSSGDIAASLGISARTARRRVRRARLRVAPSLVAVRRPGRAA